MALPSRLRNVGLFQLLDEADLAELEGKLRLRNVASGEVLMRAGDDAAEFYIVVSGRFRVFPPGRSHHVAEIGPGQPIGEIAFFGSGKRTATVTSARDGVVLVLKMKDLEAAAQRSETIWRAIAATLANQLAERNATPIANVPVRPRTIAVCRAGTTAIPAAVLASLQTTFERETRCIFVRSDTLDALRGHDGTPDDAETTSLLNRLEDNHDYVFYVADSGLSRWSEKAMRQADRILWFGQTSDGHSCEPNELERAAAGADQLGDQHLVLLRTAGGSISGTGAWLVARPNIQMHHHVVTEGLRDYNRLFRFIHGTALGLVACGGGALTAAHLGFYDALLESELEFDIMGGTSGGAATTAALALGLDGDEMSKLIDEVFVRRNALGRWTWPRYSVLDHSVLDAALVEHYTDVNIEDLPIPFFAVSTNLSRGTTHYHRRGPLWKAVRASSSIPALLPPLYSETGDILVDGCLLENVPIKGMRRLKAGPNVVVDIEVPTLDRLDVNYALIPSRSQLLLQSINPFRRAQLPLAPGPGPILLRSLMMNRESPADDVTNDDLLLLLRMPESGGHLDWNAHRRLRQIGYDFAKSELCRLREAGHPVFAGRNRAPSGATARAFNLKVKA